jgi:hypothetical protein
MLGSPRRCCDGLTRRETLKVGALSALAGGFTLPNLLAAEARRSEDGRPGAAKNVIVLYLLGGAATQDMWDLKPHAQAEVRGEFKPTDTSVPGNGNGGRDHWTHCYGTVFAGAGVRDGTVYGSSDAQAAYVKDRRSAPGTSVRRCTAAWGSTRS